MFMAGLADFLDLLPTLPGLEPIGSAIDADLIQSERTIFKEQPTSTLLQLTEIIDAPLEKLIPPPINMIPTPLELLPGNLAGVVEGLRRKYKKG